MGSLGLISLQEELLRWEERQQILGPFTQVGERGGCEPIYKHRGALGWDGEA